MNKLGDLLKVKHGFAFKGEFFSDEPTESVLVTPGNFAIGGGFRDDKLKFYDGPVPGDYILNGGDLIITMTDLSKAGDTLGYPAIVPVTANRTYLHNQRIGLVQVEDEDVLDRRFLYYRLCGSDYRHHILATASGSTVRHTSPGRIGDFEIELPPIEQQRQIASILGSLDDKIEHNRRTAQALERLARAIFKAWFVDFEPVKAKAAGATSFPSMPQDVFDALPTTFVDTEIGPVPEGWGPGKLGDVLLEYRDSVRPSELEDDTPYIGLEHMPRRSIRLAKWGEVGSVTSNKARFKAGDFLYGKLRPYFHKVGVAPLDGVCSTDIVVMRPKSPEWFAFGLGHVSSDAFVAYTNACSSGTKMPRTNWRDMSRFEAAIPPLRLADVYGGFVSPMVDSIISGIHEAHKLTEARDYLLPKLMSGEVHIEEAVEAW